MKNEKGITIVSLIITVVVMLVVAGTTVYTSNNRTKVNDLKKMQTDIELLNDKISTYYLKYGGIPVVKKDNKDELYTYSTLDFDKNVNDNNNYYIIDLEAIGNLTLNYGENGYKNPNESDDVYIINENTHKVYYVKGIEYTDGKLYHSLAIQASENTDTIPPTKPKINVLSGEKDDTKTDTDTVSYYKSDVELEFEPGKDNWSGVANTTYMINNISKEIDISTLNNNRFSLSTNGSYEILLKCYDNAGNVSQTTLTININK